LNTKKSRNVTVNYNNFNIQTPKEVQYIVPVQYTDNLNYPPMLRTSSTCQGTHGAPCPSSVLNRQDSQRRPTGDTLSLHLPLLNRIRNVSVVNAAARSLGGFIQTPLPKQAPLSLSGQRTSKVYTCMNPPSLSLFPSPFLNRLHYVWGEAGHSTGEVSRCMSHPSNPATPSSKTGYIILGQVNAPGRSPGV
jgi:hypothetical protein